MSGYLRPLVLMLTLGLAPCALLAQEGEQAEIPRGLWATEPDQLGIVLWVRTRSCGRALCGRVERAKNRAGYDAPSNAVGQLTLVKLKPQADGSFLGEYVDRNALQYRTSRVEVAGRRLRLEACNADGCSDKVWTRVK